jgi:hypothetical protein
MATTQVGFGPRLVQMRGEDPLLLERLRAPIEGALEARRQVYVVEVHALGRGGQVLVSITASEGRLPLLFDQDELEPAHVFQVVRDTVGRLGL